MQNFAIGVVCWVNLILHSQEAVFKFVACLRQHAALRNVADGAYWVCAYANNQHKLEECRTLLWAMSLDEFRVVQLNPSLIIVSCSCLFKQLV